MTNSPSAEEATAAVTEEKKRSLWLILGKPVKPVVTGGEFGCSETQSEQTGCLRNLLLPIGQCQSRKQSRVRVFLLVVLCLIQAFTVLFYCPQNAHEALIDTFISCRFIVIRLP